MRSHRASPRRRRTSRCDAPPDPRAAGLLSTSLAGAARRCSDTRPMSTTPLQIALDDGATVSALLDRPTQPLACYVFAHGAGAGMEHAFMGALAQGLAERRLATLRFQFPFMEQGSRRP